MRPYLSCIFLDLIEVVASTYFLSGNGPYWSSNAFLGPVSCNQLALGISIDHPAIKLNIDLLAHKVVGQETE